MDKKKQDASTRTTHGPRPGESEDSPRKKHRSWKDTSSQKNKKNTSGDGGFSEDVKKAADGFKEGAKKAKDKVEQEWEDLDVEETAVKGLKELEGLLASFQSTIKKKRAEYEKKGVEDTMKKDATKAKESVKETTMDILDSVEKAAKNLKNKLNKKE